MKCVVNLRIRVRSRNTHPTVPTLTPSSILNLDHHFYNESSTWPYMTSMVFNQLFYFYFTTDVQSRTEQECYKPMQLQEELMRAGSGSPDALSDVEAPARQDEDVGECRGCCISEGEDGIDFPSALHLSLTRYIPDPELAGTEPGDGEEKAGSPPVHKSVLCDGHLSSPLHEPSSQDDSSIALFERPSQVIPAVAEPQLRLKRGRWGTGRPINASSPRPGGGLGTLAMMQPSQLAVVLQGLPIVNILMVRLAGSSRPCIPALHIHLPAVCPHARTHSSPTLIHVLFLLHIVISCASHAALVCSCVCAPRSKNDRMTVCRHGTRRKSSRWHATTFSGWI